MRGAPVLTVQYIVHPKAVAAPVTFLVFIAPVPQPPPSRLLTYTPPTPTSQGQRTSLHYAAENGREAACQVLVEAGAKVDALDIVSWHCM